MAGASPWSRCCSGWSCRPSWAGLALGVAALLAFLVRTPLKLALVDIRRDRWLARSALAARVAAAELCAMAVLAATTVALGGWDWLVPIAMAVPLIAVEMWFDVRSRGRRLLPELCGAVGIGAVVAAIVVVGGDGLRLGVALWLVLAGRAVGAIPFVRVQIMRLRRGAGTTWHSDVAQIVALALGAVAVFVDHRVWVGFGGSRAAGSGADRGGCVVHRRRRRCSGFGRWPWGSDWSPSRPSGCLRADPLRNERGTNMDVIDLSATLATLVTEHPELAREFERRGFDYCCHGAQTLRAACDAAGLDPSVIAEDLSLGTSSTEPPAWASMDALTLMDHLVDTHHRYLWDELPRLSALVAKVHGVHAERHPELEAVKEVYDALRADLEPHLLKEERVLFPMARELATATSPAVVPLRHAAQPDLGDAARARHRRRTAGLDAAPHRRLSAPRRCLRVVHRLLCGARGARDRHPPARAQGEPSPVPDDRPHGGRVGGEQRARAGPVASPHDRARLPGVPRRAGVGRRRPPLRDLR